MEIKYEIHIGETYDIEKRINVSKQTLLISEDQFEVIKTFADTTKDNELNTVYKINKCEFKVTPHFKPM